MKAPLRLQANRGRKNVGAGTACEVQAAATAGKQEERRTAGPAACQTRVIWNEWDG